MTWAREPSSVSSRCLRPVDADRARARGHEMRCLAIPRDDALALDRVGADHRAVDAQGDRAPLRLGPSGRLSSLHSGGGRSRPDQADRGEPSRAARLRAHRARRGRHRSHWNRGEVGARRSGQLGQAYADIRDGEAWLIGASISEYAQAGGRGHQPDRDRKLLLHRGEIDSLHGKVREKGLTLVPTRMYFKEGA